MDEEVVVMSREFHQQLVDMMRRVQTMGDVRPQTNQVRHYEDGQRFQNKDSVTIPPNGIIIGDAFRMDFPEVGGGRDIVEVKRPSTTFPEFWFLNDRAEIEYDGFGTSQKAIKGTYRVAYDPADGTPAFGESWGWKPGTYLAKKNGLGLKALGVASREDSTNHILLATREEPPFYLCKADSSISKGSTGTVSIYTMSEVDTTINVTAKALVAAITGSKFSQFVPTKQASYDGLIYPGDCT